MPRGVRRAVAGHDENGKAEDVVVMQDTYRAWANRSSKTCMKAFILIGAEVPRNEEH
ncbi:MAG: hypothetical protein VYE18_03660 [Pseudomonadota bacterium]|nr:hypothetical protein [Pseudomonadota bacterium]